MSNRPTCYTSAIATRILDELRAGRPLFDICADEDLPSHVTVLDWVRLDRAGFAARYHQARERGYPAMVGRPTRYTAEAAARILGELAAGRTLSDVCGDDGMPTLRTVLYWVAQDRHGFKARYRQAREDGCYAMADQVVDIADGRTRDLVIETTADGRPLAVPDPDTFDRARLRCDMRRWLVARLLPQRFGARPIPTTDEKPDPLKELMDIIHQRSNRGLPSEAEIASLTRKPEQK